MKGNKFPKSGDTLIPRSTGEPTVDDLVVIAQSRLEDVKVMSSHLVEEQILYEPNKEKLIIHPHKGKSSYQLNEDINV